MIAMISSGQSFRCQRQMTKTGGILRGNGTGKHRLNLPGIGGDGNDVPMNEFEHAKNGMEDDDYVDGQDGKEFEQDGAFSLCLLVWKIFSLLK